MPQLVGMEPGEARALLHLLREAVGVPKRKQPADTRPEFDQQLRRQGHTAN